MPTQLPDYAVATKQHVSAPAMGMLRLLSRHTGVPMTKIIERAVRDLAASRQDELPAESRAELEALIQRSAWG